MENLKQKEKIAIKAGLILIAIVVSFTFLQSKKSKVETSKYDPSLEISYPVISPLELKEMINNNENPTIIDARTKDEYEYEHLIDSIHVPATLLTTKSIPNSIIVITTDDNHSKQVNDILTKRGIEFEILAGGIPMWKSANGMTVKLGNLSEFADRAVVEFIEREKFLEILNDKDFDAQFIDLRSSDQFKKNHIKGATNIPLEELEQRRNEVKNNKQVIMYGTTLLDSFQGAFKVYDMRLIPALAAKFSFQELSEEIEPDLLVSEN